MRWHRAILITAQSLLLLCGCASRSVQVAQQPSSEQRVGEVAHGSACGVLIWGIIPAGNNSRTERAYKEAVGSHSGLVDTKIQYSWYAIPYVGYLLCTTVEGRVIG